jgi:hypothetical protein
MATDPSFVRVAADGAGKAIRNLSLYVLQPDGTPTLVQMQATATVDEDGNVVDTDLKPVLDELLEVNTRIAGWMELLVGAFGGGSPVAGQGELASFLGRTQLQAPAAPSQLVSGIGDIFGRQITIPWGARDLFLPGFSGTFSDTTSHTLVAGVNDTFLDLAMLLISNTSASTNTRVDVSDGANTYPFMSIGSAGPVGFSSGLILPATTRGAGWTIQAAAAVTDLRAFALFVRNK